MTRTRLEAYRQTIADAGYDDAYVAQALGHCWVWRNVVVAETDAEAEAIGVSAFRRMREHLNSARQRLNRPGEQQARQMPSPAARDIVEQGLIYGSPTTVCERLAPSQAMGVGGVMLHFRLGPMSWEATEQSLRLFAERVAPEFRPSVPQGVA